MASVYGTVKQSGGYITLDSEPGVGTTVKVYLPQIQADRPSSIDAEAEPVETTGRTILLTEDEETVRNLVQGILRRQGHRVLSATDPADALRISAEFDEPIDLLLTDLVMPQKTGLQLAREILEQRPGTRVLIMSGYSKSTRFDSSALAAQTVFLQKPFTPDRLERAVRSALGAPPPSGQGG